MPLMTDPAIQARARIPDVISPVAPARLAGLSTLGCVEQIVTTRVNALTTRHQLLSAAEELTAEKGASSTLRAEKAEIETQIRSKRTLLRLITKQNLSLDSPQLQNINWSTQDLLLLLQMNQCLHDELNEEKADKACLQKTVSCVSEQLVRETSARRDAEARLREQEVELSRLQEQNKQMTAFARRVEGDYKILGVQPSDCFEDMWLKSHQPSMYEESALVEQERGADKVEARNVVFSVICLSVLAVPVLCPMIALLSPVLAPMVVSYFFLKYRLQLSFFSVAFHFQWSMIVPDVHWCRKIPAGPTWRWMPYPSL